MRGKGAEEDLPRQTTPGHGSRRTFPAKDAGEGDSAACPAAKPVIGMSPPALVLVLLQKLQSYFWDTTLAGCGKKDIVPPSRVCRSAPCIKDGCFPLLLS